MSLTEHARGAALRLSRTALAAAQPGGLRALRSGVEPARLLRYREVASFHGLDIRTVLYVGANRGQELPLLLTAYPEALVHCFEPTRSTFRELEARWRGEPRCRLWPVGLSDHDGAVEMHRSATHDEANSLRVPTAHMGDVFPTVTGWDRTTVDVRTLDGWVAKNPFVSDVLLKLDVQGAEDLVLAGGRRSLDGVSAVVVEVAVRPSYEGAPSAADMAALMLGNGFRYGGQLDVVRAPVGADVVEFDAVYVRPRV